MAPTVTVATAVTSPKTFSSQTFGSGSLVLTLKTTSEVAIRHADSSARRAASGCRASSSQRNAVPTAPSGTGSHVGPCGMNLTPSGSQGVADSSAAKQGPAR